MDVCKFAKSELKKYSDVKYKKFSSALIPGADNILGVRLPILRKIAKEIANIKDLTPDFVIKETSKNVKQIFDFNKGE